MSICTGDSCRDAHARHYPDAALAHVHPHNGRITFLVELYPHGPRFHETDNDFDDKWLSMMIDNWVRASFFKAVTLETNNITMAQTISRCESDMNLI